MVAAFADVAENRTTPCEDCQTVLTFKDGEIHEREFQNKQNKRWYKVVALPVKDQEGRVIYVLEAELFGYEKGAFTGAGYRRDPRLYGRPQGRARVRGPE